MLGAASGRPDGLREGGFALRGELCAADSFLHTYTQECRLRLGVATDLPSGFLGKGRWPSKGTSSKKSTPFSYLPAHLALALGLFPWCLY